MAAIHCLNKPNKPDWKILVRMDSKGIFIRLHVPAPEPEANLSLSLSLSHRGSLQLNTHCLIGSGSVVATRICYLFVAISRCEALRSLSQPGCATC